MILIYRSFHFIFSRLKQVRRQGFSLLALWLAMLFFLPNPPLFALAPNSSFPGKYLIQKEHKALESLQGLIVGGPLKDEKKENLDSVESLFAFTMPPDLREIFGNKASALSDDFVQTLLRLQKLDPLFPDRNQEIIVRMQKGISPDHFQAQLLWLVYLRQVRRLIRWTGKENFDNQLERYLRSKKKWHLNLFHKLRVAESFIRLFQGYLGELNPNETLKERMIKASFLLSIFPKGANQIRNADKELKPYFGDIRVMSTKVKSQWVTFQQTFASHGEKGITALKQILPLLKKHFGSILNEQNPDIRKQWLIVLSHMIRIKDNAITTLKKVLPLFKNHFGSILNEQNDEIRKQWLIAISQVSKEGEAAASALEKILPLFNDHFGSILNEQNDKIRKQWLIAIYEVAILGEAGVSALEKILPLFDQHFGSILNEQNPDIRKQWLTAIYNIAMKGKEGVNALEKILPVFNDHFGSILNEQNDEVRKQWLIALYEVAMKGEKGANRLPIVLGIVGKIKKDASVEEKIQWLREVYYPISRWHKKFKKDKRFHAAERAFLAINASL